MVSKMETWRRIHKFKDHDIDISAGMWLEDDRVYFTLEGLQPEDVIEQDVEFPVTINDLEHILTEAKKIQSTVVE